MTNGERILLFLRENGHCFCDDCLSDHTGIQPRQQVNQICNGTIKQDINTAQGVCHSCGKPKLVRSIQNTGGGQSEEITPEKKEIDFEEHIREIIRDKIICSSNDFILLDNKNVADIITKLFINITSYIL